MKYLLDTNIISELIAKKPNENVISFIEKVDENSLFLSVITIGEIKSGIEKIESSKRKEKLSTWLYTDLFERFENKIINVDLDVMLKWGHINQKLQKIGKPMPIMDALIASTCISKNFILLTRNEKDFINLEIEMINPFKIQKTSE